MASLSYYQLSRYVADSFITLPDATTESLINP